MKTKILILAAITIISAGTAFADGMVFDPTEYSLEYTTPSNSNSSSTSSSSASSNAAIESNIKTSSSFAQNTVSGQSENFNNALYELDSAQVNIRNELLDYQAKYQEVDTQYKLIKEQRRVLGEQVKSVEKRIKDIERSKSQIRKTMI